MAGKKTKSMEMTRQFTHDSVAITGSVIGILSFAFGWFTLRPNRLAAGTSLSVWESARWESTAIILVLWLACLGLSVIIKRRWHAAGLGIAANLIIIITFVLAGSTATRLVTNELARVSLGTGFWLTLGGAYVVIFTARQKLRNFIFWQNAVSWSALAVILALLITGWLNELSIMKEFFVYKDRFLQELWKHIFLFGVSVTLGTLIGIPLGIWAVQSKRAEKPVFFIANITQTIPSLALFGLLIAPLSSLSFAFPILREWGIRGVGSTPALIALIIYSLLPIVRNTYASLRQIDPAVINAGFGMGMSNFQTFRKIKMPLAAPIVLEGVRTAFVQAVGLAAVAALIGAGGLGWFIFQGIGQSAPDLIILGAIPVIILALIVDAVMRNVVRLVMPKGLTGEKE